MATDASPDHLNQSIKLSWFAFRILTTSNQLNGSFGIKGVSVGQIAAICENPLRVLSIDRIQVISRLILSVLFDFSSTVPDLPLEIVFRSTFVRLSFDLQEACQLRDLLPFRPIVVRTNCCGLPFVRRSFACLSFFLIGRTDKIRQCSPTRRNRNDNNRPLPPLNHRLLPIAFSPSTFLTFVMTVRHQSSSPSLKPVHRCLTSNFRFFVWFRLLISDFISRSEH
jgi:hypothetical protein